jgi:hypothetical protein
MRKADPKSQQRGGQLMLGSVANHAWAEDSLYLRLTRGEIFVERESKHTTSGTFRIGNVRNKAWQPIVKDLHTGMEENEAEGGEVRTAKTKGRKKDATNKSLEALKGLGPGKHKTMDIADRANLTRSSAWNQLTRMEEKGYVKRPSPGTWEVV